MNVYEKLFLIIIMFISMPLFMLLFFFMFVSEIWNGDVTFSESTTHFFEAFIETLTEAVAKWQK